MNKIAIAGSILVDKIYQIDKYPNEGELTQINDISKSTGGLVCNVAIDLKKLDDSLSIKAIGKIGNDDDGKYAIDVLNSNQIDTTNVVVSSKTKTSFTDVMSINGGQRTFFSYSGACKDFGYDDIDFDTLDVDMIHLGYFLLLEKIDNGDGLKILQECSKRNIITSIDLVSENSDRYQNIIPCLKYVNNLIVNELEASKLSNIAYDGTNIKEIALKLKELGVKDRVIIHMPSQSICISNDGITTDSSFVLPANYIKGTTGAGDAFCAGCLLAISRNYNDLDILKTGKIASLGALRKQDAISGMDSLEILKKISEDFKC